MFVFEFLIYQYRIEVKPDVPNKWRFMFSLKRYIWFSISVNCSTTLSESKKKKEKRSQIVNIKRSLVFSGTFLCTWTWTNKAKATHNMIIQKEAFRIYKHFTQTQRTPIAPPPIYLWPGRKGSPGSAKFACESPTTRCSVPTKWRHVLFLWMYIYETFAEEEEWGRSISGLVAFYVESTFDCKRGAHWCRTMSVREFERVLMFFFVCVCVFVCLIYLDPWFCPLFVWNCS